MATRLQKVVTDREDIIQYFVIRFILLKTEQISAFLEPMVSGRSFVSVVRRLQSLVVYKRK